LSLPFIISTMQGSINEGNVTTTTQQNVTAFTAPG